MIVKAKHLYLLQWACLQNPSKVYRVRERSTKGVKIWKVSTGTPTPTPTPTLTPTPKPTPTAVLSAGTPTPTPTHTHTIFPQATKNTSGPSLPSTVSYSVQVNLLWKMCFLCLVLIFLKKLVLDLGNHGNQACFFRKMLNFLLKKNLSWSSCQSLAWSWLLSKVI